jgi:hypothetical protein
MSAEWRRRTGLSLSILILCFILLLLALLIPPLLLLAFIHLLLDTGHGGE